MTGEPKLTKDSQVPWYFKEYRCDCGCEWDDEWDCECNDPCPDCGAECEVLASKEKLVPIAEAAANVGSTLDDYIAERNIYEGRL